MTAAAAARCAHRAGRPRCGDGALVDGRDALWATDGCGATRDTTSMPGAYAGIGVGSTVAHDCRGSTPVVAVGSGNALDAAAQRVRERVCDAHGANPASTVAHRARRVGRGHAVDGAHRHIERFAASRAGHARRRVIARRLARDRWRPAAAGHAAHQWPARRLWRDRRERRNARRGWRRDRTRCRCARLARRARRPHPLLAVYGGKGTRDGCSAADCTICALDREMNHQRRMPRSTGVTVNPTLKRSMICEHRPTLSLSRYTYPSAPL